MRAPRYPVFTFDSPSIVPVKSRLRSLVGNVLLAPGYFVIYLLGKLQ